MLSHLINIGYRTLFPDEFKIEIESHTVLPVFTSFLSSFPVISVNEVYGEFQIKSLIQGLIKNLIFLLCAKNIYIHIL